jgi:uncharacterized membrane protein
MDDEQKKKLKEAVMFSPTELVQIIVTMLLLEWVAGSILERAGEFWAYVFLLVVIVARLGGIDSKLKKIAVKMDVQV